MKTPPGNTCLLVLSCVFLFGCQPEPTSVMTIEADERLWIQRDLLASETEQPVASRYYYDVTGERIFIEAHVFPAEGMLTVNDVDNAEKRFFGFGVVGLSNEFEETKNQVGAIPLDPNASMILSSSLARSIGPDLRKQPYGTLELRTAIDETGYEVERRSGWLFGSDTYTEKVGDGTVTLSLASPDGTSLFTLRDKYTLNSKEYTATFTPDGRYVLVVLPDNPQSTAAQLPGGHRFILVGGLPISRDKESISADLLLQGKAREARQAKKKLEQQYRDGFITPDEYYGEVYTSARKKIEGCRELRNLIGPITSLTVQDRVLGFGQPQVVGKVFTFDYRAETGTGSIQVISLEPEHVDVWASAYEEYLTSVDIRTSSGVSYAACP